jgi:hypothetical protein
MATQQNRNPFMGDDVFCMRLCAFMIHMQKKLCGTPQAGPRTLAMVAQTLAGVRTTKPRIETCAPRFSTACADAVTKPWRATAESTSGFLKRSRSPFTRGGAR